MTKWIRADHAQSEKKAAVAAAYEDAAELVFSMRESDMLYGVIRARADDAIAARDATRDAKVRAEARRELADKVVPYDGATMLWRSAILALIPSSVSCANYADQKHDQKENLND